MSQRLRHLLAAVVCTVLLLAVLSLYMQPQFMVTLADQLWGCF